MPYSQRMITMIEYIFERIVVLSAIGSLLSLILLAIRPFTKKVFSSKWHYLTYVLAMLVFLIPLSVSLPSEKAYVTADDKINIPNTAENVHIITVTTPNYDTVDTDTQASTPMAEKTRSFNPILNQITKHAFLIWGFGFVLYLSFSLFSHFAFIKKALSLSKEDETRRFCTVHKSDVRVIRTSHVSSPVLVGIFKPRLFIPDTELSESDIGNILLHESVHAKRKDIAVKWLCLFAKAVHWFNPTVFFLSRRIDIECEISCDVLATSTLEAKGIENYCETILSLIITKDKKSCTALCAGGTKKSLERRFKAIMDRKKVSKRTAVISVIIAAVLTVGAITASAVFGGKVEKKNETENKPQGIDNNQEPTDDDTENGDGTIAVYDTDEDYNPVVIYRVPKQDDEAAVLSVIKTQEADKTEYELTPVNEAENSTVRVHPITGERISEESVISHGFDEKTHPAVDYRLEAGTVITSPIDGIITVAEYASDKGNHIEIEGNDGTTRIIFAHLDKMYVSKGDKVNAGDTVGTVGSTGLSTGPHLHVEYYENGKAENPVRVFIIEENGEILAVLSKPEQIID